MILFKLTVERGQEMLWICIKLAFQACLHFLIQYALKWCFMFATLLGARILPQPKSHHAC